MVNFKGESFDFLEFSKEPEWYTTTNTKIKSDALTLELTFPPTGL